MRKNDKYEKHYKHTLNKGSLMMKVIIIASVLYAVPTFASSRIKRTTSGFIEKANLTFTNIQQIKVRGQVTDDKGDAIPGASIKVKGVKITTLTDKNGIYALSNLPANATLVISYIGKKSQEILVDDQSVINVVLENSATDLEEVVVLGYGTQKKELLTGAVATMKMDKPRRLTPTTSLGNLLAGQLPGVNVGTPNGIPGNQPSISIRAKSSWNDQNVLYVIDGKIGGAGDFNNLSPNDIDNISVLKDAASAAVYGARAAGGVIVVTTRRGSKEGRAQIDYAYSTGIDKRGKNAKLTSAIETGQIYNRLNPTATNKFTQEDFDFFKGVNNGWGYDQLDAVWNDPKISSHNLSVSGGGEKIQYFVGGSYVKQGGFMKNLSYDKYNLRTNITANLTDDLTLFAGLTINNNLAYGPTNTAVGDVPGIYRKQLLWQPWQPVWTDGGNPIDYGWIGNVGAEVRGDGGYVKSNGLKPILNLQATYKIPQIEGLSASVQFNKSYTNDRSKNFIKQYDMWVMKQYSPNRISTKDEDLLSIKQSSSVGKPYISEKYDWSNDYQLNFQLTYDHTFNDVHSVKGWLIYEQFEAQGGGIDAGRENFPVYVTDQWWAASEDRLDSYANGSNEFKDGRKSWIGQAFYDYKGKYLASFAYRYDGSMKFAEDKRWGFFPSGSIGWIVSKENFFNNVEAIQMLKLRGSVGMTGNDGVGGWQWQQSYEKGNSIFFGTDPINHVGVSYGGLTNPDLTWEKTLNYNAGVDVDFLENFTATAEYYFVKTYDILGARVASVPPTFSRTLPSANYGQIDANGVEFSIGYRNRKEAFNYYINANASYANAVYKIQDQNVTYPYDDNIGQSANRINAYTQIGMLRTQKELDDFVAAHPNYTFNGIKPALGQLIYQDLSGKDGVPDGVIDAWDISTVKDNNNPVVLGINIGFEWKGFSVDASFNGALNQTKMVNTLVEGNVEWNRMWQNWATDAWTPETPNATLPIRYSANDGANSVTNTASTFWLKKADFLRLKLLNIGYSIPEKIAHKIGAQGLRVYFSGSNLFIISRFNREFFDPELEDGFSYPIMKSYNFGVNVSF